MEQDTLLEAATNITGCLAIEFKTSKESKCKCRTRFNLHTKANYFNVTHYWQCKKAYIANFTRHQEMLLEKHTYLHPSWATRVGSDLKSGRHSKMQKLLVPTLTIQQGGLKLTSELCHCFLAPQLQFFFPLNNAVGIGFCRGTAFLLHFNNNNDCNYKETFVDIGQITTPLPFTSRVGFRLSTMYSP